ncbi:MAG TPA: hypothetical protein VK544_07475, partial [Gemmatimonadaceae bacterium]|nr:hypothetical protein [Gemmatimonadaceae bacterium]
MAKAPVLSHRPSIGAKPPTHERSRGSATFDRIIKGGNVVTPAGTFIGDVGITGERITALGLNLEGDASTELIDAKGHHVIPGVLDVHVHLELPFCGTVSADDYTTG